MESTGRPRSGARLFVSASALEAQKFPDAPKQPGFLSARVDPGKPYRHVMIYRVGKAAEAR